MGRLVKVGGRRRYVKVTSPHTTSPYLSYLKIKSKTRLNVHSFELNFPSHLAKGKRDGISHSLVEPQISVKDLSSNKWVGLTGLTANQKWSRDLLQFLSPSNELAFLSILGKTVYTDNTWG